MVQGKRRARPDLRRPSSARRHGLFGLCWCCADQVIRTLPADEERVSMNRRATAAVVGRRVQQIAAQRSGARRSVPASAGDGLFLGTLWAFLSKWSFLVFVLDVLRRGVPPSSRARPASIGPSDAHTSRVRSAAITKRFFDLGWMERMTRSHAVVVTPWDGVVSRRPSASMLRTNRPQETLIAPSGSPGKAVPSLEGGQAATAMASIAVEVLIRVRPFLHQDRGHGATPRLGAAAA